jgi:predicted DCC family thiol-disulfide oxidoreductase YuxK
MKLKYEIAVVATGILLVAAPLLFWRRAPRFIKEFFGAVSAPLNLAIFRIVLFVVVFFSFSVHNIAWYGSIPQELRFPPPGLYLVLQHLPLNEDLAWYTSLLLVIFCLTSIAGLFTRFSIIASLFLSLYVLGIPQFFGKVNHYHHLVWFMAILAVSPCADVLSIDAVRASWKRADRGITEPPEPSQAYALPLRFVWLIMGVIYFSAGFWKVWTAGIAWGWSDNPRNLMYNKWMELSGWTPVFRIDHYPFLYKISGVSTLLFELSFIFLIFFPSVRFLAPLGGLVFHNMTNLFMRISFVGLQACYVAFVDWRKLFRYVGRKLFKKDMYIVFDGNCKRCRRTIASFRVFDILERVIYVNALDDTALRTHQLSWLNADEILRDIYAVVGQETWAGFSSYRVWIKRLPLLWPLLPFLYLWPIELLGQRIYRHVADSRACDPSEARSLAFQKNASNRKAIALIAGTGALITYAAVLTAVGKIYTWPISGYPTFEDIDKPEVDVLVIAVEKQDGSLTQISPLKQESLGELPPERLMGMLNHLLAVENETERRARLQAFWRLWSQANPNLRTAVDVKFYRDTLSSLPENQGNDPIRRKLVYEFRP